MNPSHHITTAEQRQLRLFRNAASQVREATIIAEDQKVVIQGRFRPTGEGSITWRLLESEPFRSLALSVRLVYQQQEEAHFNKICNLLWRVSDETIRAVIVDVRKRYTAILNSSPVGAMLVSLDGQIHELSAQEVFETWMYTGVFHQDTERLSVYDALLQRQESFLFAVQTTALQLCGRILQLDGVVADALGEPQLPPIPPSAPEDPILPFPVSNV